MKMEINPTEKMYLKLVELDKANIGTADYMGLAFFWSREYKHGMRAASPETRAAVHAAMLLAGLDVRGESDQHEAIVQAYTEGETIGSRICLAYDIEEEECERIFAARPEIAEIEMPSGYVLRAE